MNWWRFLFKAVQNRLLKSKVDSHTSMESNIFEHNARTLRKLKGDIETAFTHRDLDETHRSLWIEACRSFHASFDPLAFPGGLDRELMLLKTGDQEAVEMAIRFLEANPWFFRSGYIKEELLRRLCHADLANTQKDRLRVVISARIDHGAGREFRRYGQLARTLYTQPFHEAVHQRSESADGQVASRAGLVLQIMES